MKCFFVDFVFVFCFLQLVKKNEAEWTGKQKLDDDGDEKLDDGDDKLDDGDDVVDDDKLDVGDDNDHSRSLLWRYQSATSAILLIVWSENCI